MSWTTAIPEAQPLATYLLAASPGHRPALQSAGCRTAGGRQPAPRRPLRTSGQIGPTVARRASPDELKVPCCHWLAADQAPWRAALPQPPGGPELRDGSAYAKTWARAASATGQRRRRGGEARRQRGSSDVSGGPHFLDPGLSRDTAAHGDNIHVRQPLLDPGLSPYAAATGHNPR